MGMAGRAHHSLVPRHPFVYTILDHRSRGVLASLLRAGEQHAH
jgi:hypothetical protein